MSFPGQLHRLIFSLQGKREDKRHSLTPQKNKQSTSSCTRSRTTFWLLSAQSDVEAFTWKKKLFRARRMHSLCNNVIPPLTERKLFLAQTSKLDVWKQSHNTSQPIHGGGDIQGAFVGANIRGGINILGGNIFPGGSYTQGQGGNKPVSSSLKPEELQYYFSPFSKAVKWATLISIIWFNTSCLCLQYECSSMSLCFPPGRGSLGDSEDNEANLPVWFLFRLECNKHRIPTYPHHECAYLIHKSVIIGNRYSQTENTRWDFQRLTIFVLWEANEYTTKEPLDSQKKVWWNRPCSIFCSPEWHTHIRK